MPPRSQSYISYNWPDKPLGSGHIPVMYFFPINRDGFSQELLVVLNE